jgi:uncharacterized protein YdgA (DUF945 family)
MIKRILLVVLAVLLLVVAVGYPAGAWYAGKQIEATLDEQYKALHDSIPIMTVGERQYKGGIFSSEESLKLNITLVPGAKPLQLTMKSHIRQLPLSGILAQEMVDMDSEVAFAEGSLPELTSLFGGNKLASVHTAYNFDGGGSSSVTVPAFNSATLSSAAGTLNIKFGKAMESYSMLGSLPKITISDKNSGGKVQFSGIQISGDHKRFLAGPPAMYGGTDHIAIDQVDASGPGVPVEPGFIKRLTVDATAVPSANNEFVDVTEKFKLGALKIMGKDYGPAQFDMSFRHLHAKTLAGMSQMNWVAADMNPAFATQHFEALLTHNPEVRIDRFSFTRPEGETVVSAVFSLKDAQPGDLSNPMTVMSKGYVSADFKVPEKLLADFSQGAPIPASMSGGGMDKELERMVGEGYFTRDGGFIMTKFEFHDGLPWFNGKQYVPPPPPAPPAPPPRAARKKR